MQITRRQLRQLILEASTEKYDDNKNLKGDQDELPDNLQRAMKSIQEDEVLKKSKEFDKFFKNIEIIEKDLISIFEKNKIVKINCLNKAFDPNFHQAMLEIEDDKVEPGTIVQEIQTGFMFGERLLRPSFVGISKKKGEKDEKNK